MPIPVRTAGGVRPTIIEQIGLVAHEQKRKLAPLADDLPLIESGLDSLSFAVLVARLEEKLGFDPFSTSDEVQFPVTFGDFVHVYESFSK